MTQIQNTSHTTLRPGGGIALGGGGSGRILRAKVLQDSRKVMS
jgi:hypothetical protein